MAKSLLRLKARKLRKRGVSVRKIAQVLGVSKSTVSLWVRDIILTIEQLESLQNSRIKGSEKGRLMGAFVQKERRLKLIEDSKLKGIELLSNLTEREFLITGLALYWGEGCRKKRDVSFCNSDPRMVKFLILWLQKCFGVKSEDIKCRVGINEIHEKRDQVVKKYWSEVTGIPLIQFKNTSYKRVKNKKIYENFNQHFGTLTVTIKRPGVLYYEIMGLIEGLACQGSSVVRAPDSYPGGREFKSHPWYWWSWYCLRKRPKNC